MNKPPVTFRQHWWMAPIPLPKTCAPPDRAHMWHVVTLAMLPLHCPAYALSIPGVFRVPGGGFGAWQV